MKTTKAPQTATLTPVESPLLSFEDAAGLLFMSVDSLRRCFDRPSDKLAVALRPLVVEVSERRRYFRRREFFAWLDSKVA